MQNNDSQDCLACIYYLEEDKNNIWSQIFIC